MTLSIHRVRRNSEEYALDQGEHYDLAFSYNPDDECFYIHSAGTTDGTNVLARFAANSKGWANAVAYARRKAQSQATTSPSEGAGQPDSTRVAASSRT